MLQVHRGPFPLKTEILTQLEKCRCHDVSLPNDEGECVDERLRAVSYMCRTYGVENDRHQRCVCGAGAYLNSSDANGLRSYEMLVKGTYIHDRILPGFQYHVRILHHKRSDRYQFGGEALYLVRIGQSYGKRLTFGGKYANLNPYYFWSDTHPTGYAFTINAVRPGDKFVLCQRNSRPFGRATVVATSQHQVELSSAVEEKRIRKRVLVAMQITVRYTCEPHGMMSLRADEMLDVIGVAVVERAPREGKAVTRCIEEVAIPGHGECLLCYEQV